MTMTPRICVPEHDMQRLIGLLATPLAQRFGAAAEALDAELARAEVVDARTVAPNVATMNSQVLYEDRVTHQRREVTLVYPADADPEQGRLSVFSPLASALLGLAEGDEIDWPLRNGGTLQLRLLRVLYQPEAAGHWDR